jgi:rhamnogalacturonan endolyase
VAIPGAAATAAATAPALGGGGGRGFGTPSAIVKYGAGKIGEFEGRLVGMGDIVGDWREEIVVCLPGELRVYTTTIPTSRRRVTLAEDPLYRKDMALQAMGYIYPPQLSYHFR